MITKKGLLRGLGLLAAAGILWLSASGCGEDRSYDVYDSTYIKAAGVKDTAFELLPLNAGAGAPVYIASGTQLSGGTIPTQVVRMSFRINDQRTGASDIILDYPFAKTAWQIQDDTAPRVVFTLVHDGAVLYTMGDPKESLWSHNDYNSDKNDAIAKYDHTPQELFNGYTIKATVTLTQAMYDAQVKPLIFQPAPAKTG